MEKLGIDSHMCGQPKELPEIYKDIFLVLASKSEGSFSDPNYGNM